MGLPLKLTIRDHDTGQDYVYEDDRILVDVDTINRRVRGLDVELEDMPMRIGPPASGQNELLGYTDALGLPEGTYRAKLERPDGTLLMNGAVVMSDVLYDHKERSWTFPIINQAPKDFWGLLERSFTPTQLGTVSQENIEAHVIRGDLLFEESRTFYQPKGVLQFILDDNNITYSMPAKLWEYEVQYAAQGGPETISFDSTNLLMSLGQRNEKTLVEEITRLAGWRIQVQYQGFPSTDLEATFLPTGWPAPAAAATLDDKIAGDDYEIKVEDEKTNWGLALNQGTDVTSPDPRTFTFDNRKLENVRTYAYPPTYGAVAPEVWRAAAPGGAANIDDNLARPVDDREMLADLVSTRLEAPPIAPKYTTSAANGREHQVYGPILLEDTLENPLRRTNENEKLFLFEYIYDSDERETFATVIRHPQSGRELSDGILSHSAAWASSAYQGQPLRRRGQRQLEAPFIDVGPQDIGDPGSLVEVVGSKWMAYEEERNVAKNVNDLTLRRPKQPTSKLPDRGVTSPGFLNQWIVVKPRAEFRYLDLDDGKGSPQDWFLIHWQPPPLQNGTETWYHVEYRDNANNGDWTRIDQALFGDGGDRIYGTALVYQFNFQGGDRTPSDNDIVGRVRPVKTYGEVGDWRTFEIEKE